uniref:Uncharacterized protein n=1 Tax=Rhizophora mucronata TaxID=61149 RepID=A0A2P2KXE5_RHIMU
MFYVAHNVLCCVIFPFGLTATVIIVNLARRFMVLMSFSMPLDQCFLSNRIEFLSMPICTVAREPLSSGFLVIIAQ